MPFGNIAAAIAARGLVVITREKKLRFKAAEKALLREHGLRVMALTGENDMTSWEMLVRLMQRWPKIEREIARHGDGYW